MTRLGWLLVWAGLAALVLSGLPLAHYLLFVDPAGNPVGYGMLLWVGSGVGMLMVAAGLAFALSSGRPSRRRGFVGAPGARGKPLSWDE